MRFRHRQWSPRAFGRSACVGLVLMVVLATAGCSASKPTPTTDAPQGGASREATPGRSAERFMRSEMPSYDRDYVRIPDTTRVRRTYGVDFRVPVSAAGGRLEGLWMQVPDVDGGYAFALYPESGVKITLWIAPSESEAPAEERAERGSEFPPRGGATTRVLTLDGRRVYVTPRVWLPETRYRAIGPGPDMIPAHYSEASVRWAVGRCSVNVTSRDRDVSDLLDVARAVRLSGKVRFPAPAK